VETPFTPDMDSCPKMPKFAQNVEINGKLFRRFPGVVLKALGQD